MKLMAQMKRLEQNKVNKDATTNKNTPTQNIVQENGGQQMKMIM
jgi:hypothetical protein